MAVTTVNPAWRLLGPPELLPGCPDAIIDLQTDAGVELVGGQWRYADARVEDVDFVELGSAADPLGPGDVPNRTQDIVPHAQAAGFDDSGWQVLRQADQEEDRHRLDDPHKGQPGRQPGRGLPVVLLAGTTSR